MMSRPSSNYGSALWVHGLWALVAVSAFGGGYLASWSSGPPSRSAAGVTMAPLPRAAEPGESHGAEDPARVADSFPKAPVPGKAAAAEAGVTGVENLPAQVSPTPLPMTGAVPVLETTDDAAPPRGSELTPDQAHRLLSGTVRFDPGTIPSSSLPVTAETPLLHGQHLQVKWGENWWAGTVMGLEADGRVRVHYFGWADSWDEFKTRAELQLDHSAPLRAVDSVYVRRK